MLTIKNLSKSFYGNKVLKHFSFKGESGEILGMIGANGAGKSTLFKCISGELQINSGEIYLENQAIQNKKAQEFFRLGIVRCFQKAIVIPSLTVIENVLIGAHAKIKYNLLDVGLRNKKFTDAEKKYHEYAQSILKKLKLDAQFDDQSDSLSMMDMRKMELARSVISDPKVLLIDEITAGLNSSETNQMRDLIKSFKNKNRLMVIVEHNVDFLFDLCDRICVIDDGKLIMEGSASDVKKNAKVQAVYLGGEVARR